MRTKYYVGYVFENGAVITSGPLIPDKRTRKWEIECSVCKTKAWKFSSTLKKLKYPCKKCYDNSLKTYDDSSAKKAAYRSLCSNAKSRGYSVNISFEQFLDLAEQDCYYCGDKPRERPGVKSWHASAKLNGIDRKNNMLGYTAENSVPCCQQCNWAKKDLTMEEWAEWVGRLIKMHGVLA